MVGLGEQKVGLLGILRLNQYLPWRQSIHVSHHG
jgi:hypothetical protein